MLAIDLALFGKKASELGLPVEWLKDWQEAKKNALATVYTDAIIEGKVDYETVLDACKRTSKKSTARKKAATARKVAKSVARKSKKSLAKHVKRVAKKVKDQLGVPLDEAVAIATWLVMDEITLKALLGQDNLAILDMIKLLAQAVKDGYITVTPEGDVEVVQDELAELELDELDDIDTALEDDFETLDELDGLDNIEASEDFGLDDFEDMDLDFELDEVVV